MGNSQQLESELGTELESEAKAVDELDDFPGIEALLDYLKRTRGFDFTGYKRASLGRRIRKRMQTVRVESYAEYIDLLEVDASEFGELCNTILINVTSFFRDPSAWEYLAEQALPALLNAKASDDPIRVWSVGCASGEEAYTLAIVLAELLGMDRFRERVKIYAADADEQALTQARVGSYTQRDVRNVPPPLLEKYFERADTRHIFRKDLRRALIFGRHDLMQDPPISRIDLLTCRNVLMYFNADTQKKILSRFHFALNTNGLLFLGRAETLLTQSSAFAPVELKQRIFAKMPRVTVRDRASGAINDVAPPSDPSSEQRLDRLRAAALDGGPIAHLVTDSHNIVTLVNERARTLFGLALADVGRPLQDLEISYRPVELRSIIDQVSTDRRPTILKEFEWVAAGVSRWFDVHVEPLFGPTRQLVGVMISFSDVTRGHELQGALAHAKGELEAAYQELQSTNEELETTNEELQSTVEELETTNEELQSTNEELETMNEELQSTNEELQTINLELACRDSDRDGAAKPQM